MLNIQNYIQLINNIKTMKELENLHNTWMCRLISKKYEISNNRVFPKAPFEGNDHIQPITSYKELYIEGKEMHNCVITYANLVIEGQSFIYKLIYPERATVELRLENNYWKLSQIKAVCNSAVKYDTEIFIKNWLKHENTKLINSRKFKN